MHTLPYWRLSGYYFCYFAFNGAFLPYFGLYLLSIHFSPWDVGVLMSLMSIMRLFGPGLWGWLADCKGWRVSIVACSALVSLIGFSLFFWQQSFGGVAMAICVLGFFWSAALPLVESLTFNHLREASGQYSRIRLWGSVGFVLAVLGTGALLDYVAIGRMLMVCWLLLLSILLMALTLPEAAPTPHRNGKRPLGLILRQSRVQALLAASFAMAVAHGAFYIFFSIHLATYAYGKGVIGLLWSLGVVAEIAVFLCMARVLQAFSLRSILLACFAAAVVRFVLIGWWAASPALLVLAQLLHALTFGACHAASIAAINLWFPGNAQARGQALYSSVSFGAGGLLGGVISGYLWQAAGAASTFAVSSAFALVGLFLIAWGVPAHAPQRSSA